MTNLVIQSRIQLNLEHTCDGWYSNLQKKEGATVLMPITVIGNCVNHGASAVHSKLYYQLLLYTGAT